LRQHWGTREIFTKVASGGTVALLFASLAGCERSSPGATGSEAPSTIASNSPAPVVPSGPVITEKKAVELLGQMSEQNNAANATYNTGELKKFESEASFAADSAYFTGSKILDPDGAKAPKSYAYKVDGLRAPSAPGAQWFVVQAKIDGKTGRYPLVIARDAADQPWRLVHNASMKELLPATAKDSIGNAEVVAPDDGAGLPASPAQVTQAHAQYIAGDKGAGNQMFASDTITAEYAPQDKIRQALAFQDGPATDFTTATVVAPYPGRALRAADGAALVAYTTLTTYTATKAGAKAKLTGFLGAIAPANLKDTISVEVLNMWWVSVPASGQVKVLGGSSQPVKVS
jgi:hypothetical protein